jgi:hypothetical protein
MAEQDPGATARSANEEELLRSSDVFLTELDRVDVMERRKREMSGSDDERVPLAHEIEDATIGLVGLSRYQTRLVEMESQSLGGADGSGRKPAVILEEWRAAERSLRDARTVMERATDAADALREEHRRSIHSRTE